VLSQAVTIVREAPVQTAITNATVITGDGRTILPEGSLILEDEIIIDVVPIKYLAYSVADRIIDAQGGYVLPGIINSHAHALTTGPFFPYAYPPLSWQRVAQELNTHLRNGTTTMLNLDGFNTPSEVEFVNKRHPMRVKTATAHTLLNVKASDIINGRGLKEKHRRLTVETMVRAGAVAIGEIGSPGTTNGAAEMCAKLGRQISTPQAGAIVKLFWPDLKPTRAQIERVLLEAELAQFVNVEDAEELYRDCYAKPIKASQEAIVESIEYSKRWKVPVSIHNAPQTTDAVLTAAKELGPMMIALHCNYKYSPEEALDLAKKIKEYGGWIEVITGDMLGAKQLFQDTDVTFALLRAGIVDLISTDFSGGYADPIIHFADVAVKGGAVGLAQVVAMCTSNHTKAIPGLADNRGILAEGRIADICITEPDNLSCVTHVLIGGEVVWSK
jgi:imidazolonepropionase-like amidohydrolase